MARYNTIIFDLGFTLVIFENFTLERYFKTLNQGLDSMTQFLLGKNIITDPIKFKKKFKMFRNRNFEKSLINNEETTTEETLRQTLEFLNIHPIDPQILQKAVLIYHSTEGAFWKIRTTAKPILQQLKAENFKLGVLSNAPFHQGILSFLEVNEISQYFDAIATSAQIGFCKPHRRTFEFILEKLESKPSQSIMVGDDLKNDIYGAQQIGMKTIYLKKNFNLPSSHSLQVVPDYEIEDLPEIIPIIRKWNNS